MTFICSESLPHNLCFLTTFSPVPLYKTLDVDMWILGRISLLSTISISKRFSAFSPFPFRHLFTPPVLPPPHYVWAQVLPSFLLYPSALSDSFASIHPLIYPEERQRGNTPAESCWVIQCRRETACRRSNNARSLLGECALSVSLPPLLSSFFIH